VSRTIGVLGGMGPAATADFYTRLVAATRAERDQDHLRVLIDSNPRLPCRVSALAGRGVSPGPELAAMATGLERAGAELLVMPCNTAHAWAGEIRAAVGVPFLDMVEATVEAARAARPGLKRVGVLATAGCLDAGLYREAFGTFGVKVVETGPEMRARFAALVGHVKAGDVGAEVRAGMGALAAELVEAGAELIVAGCTEVPLVLVAGDVAVPLISSTDALVTATLRAALDGLRPGV
jgi:aspartate racemase